MSFTLVDFLDAVHRVEHRGGVVLIQSTSDNKGTRPRKLRLNLKATSADEADSDALAGALSIAFLIKHRRLSLESALEIIKARRPGNTTCQLQRGSSVG